MFANLALSPDEDVASAFISFSLYFHQKIANYVIRLSNSGLQKAGKIIKIPYFLSNADISNNLLNFNVLIKRCQIVAETENSI